VELRVVADDDGADEDVVAVERIAREGVDATTMAELLITGVSATTGVSTATAEDDKENGEVNGEKVEVDCAVTIVIYGL
jgi:hypothetical protein